MKTERAGDDDSSSSQSVAPERVPSSKHINEGPVSPERVLSAKRGLGGSALAEKVLSAKRRHEGHDNVEEETAKRIRVAFPNAKKHFVEVFNSISSDDQVKVEAAVKALCIIFEEERMEDGITFAFMRLGGHINLINAMKKHSNCIEIQRWACYIISRICYGRRNIVALEGVGGLEGIAANFGAVGAFDRIKECLESFRENENLVQFAVTSCNKLLVSAIKHNLDRFLESVGIDMVVESMKEFSKDEDIQVFGCHILWLCLESRKGVIDLLRNAGAISVIGAIMDHYPGESVAGTQAKSIMKVILLK